jgi:ribosomal protein S18 acetylase RimI-like enzyme
VIVRSLALTTELALAASRGRVTDRDDYLVVETPDDPNYYDGNVLVLPAAPQVGEVAYWTRKFGEELGKNPAIKHVSLWWDGLTGDAGAEDELRAHGFTIIRNQVMVADEMTARLLPALPIRPLTPDEVLQTAELAYTIGDRHDDTYRLFLERRAAWHRELVEKNAATFWGAFDGAAFVASLGVAWLDETFARYQDVQTLPAYRGRGLASALLATSAAGAFERGVEHVVIVAEPESEAARIYERLGFHTHERTAAARRVP